MLFSLALFSPSFANPVHAQTDTIRFENISTEQGISQSIVNAILQVRKGFLWFATEGGLNQYDGYQFTVNRHEPGKPSYLTRDRLTGVQVVL
jgi:ligand-binding sensor domain-containing protein